MADTEQVVVTVRVGGKITNEFRWAAPVGASEGYLAEEADAIGSLVSDRILEHLNMKGLKDND